MNIKKIKQLIKERGLNQSEFAKAIGVSTSFMTMMLQGLKIPSLALAKRIADVLNTTIDDLISEE